MREKRGVASYLIHSLVSWLIGKGTRQDTDNYQKKKTSETMQGLSLPKENSVAAKACKLVSCFQESGAVGVISRCKKINN